MPLGPNDSDIVGEVIEELHEAVKATAIRGLAARRALQRRVRDIVLLSKPIAA